ncbi:MAG: helix-turn-helix transcriptional regulator [Enterobacterales bacterium]|nr:helix-turn-helix transcriptional regulator [Enterobacterales bacterium]
MELSLQEIKIISYISHGFTIARIANILGLSVKTVSAHKRRVMRKFNIKNNVELITLCKVTLQITNQSKVCFIP